MTDGYEMVMPFVNVTSVGGQFDDDSYTAGFQMGKLWVELEHAPTADGAFTVREENERQADLVAMHHGFSASFAPLEGFDGWSLMSVHKGGEGE